MTFLSYAAALSFFIYSLFLLIQTNELVRRNTLGSLSLTEVTFRLYSGYVITRKVLALDDPYLIAGQTVFTCGIVILWSVAFLLGVRDCDWKHLLAPKPVLNILITISMGAILALLPLDGGLVLVGAVLIYGVIVQSIKVLQRKSILSIVVSEVTIRLIGCYFVTAKIISTGDYWYSMMQVCFATALTGYWAILILTGVREASIQERYRTFCAATRSFIKPSMP